jgi:uncharacterized protein (TIGR02118 family)
MIKVSVFYPNSEGSTFDMDYYLNKHIPMARQLMGPALTSVNIEQGLSGPSLGSPPAFIAMAHLGFDSVESFGASWGPHADEIRADMPNYTNIVPTVQISTVRV